MDDKMNKAGETGNVMNTEETVKAERAETVPKTQNASSKYIWSKDNKKKKADKESDDDSKKKIPFYKKPTLYIILTVIFSLLIVADIVLAIFGARFTSANSMGRMSMDVSDMTDMSEMMGDVDTDSSDSEDSEDADSDTDTSDFTGRGGMNSQGGMGFSGGMSGDGDTDSDSGMGQGGMGFSGDMNSDSDSSDMPSFDSDSSGMPSFDMDSDSDTSGIPSMGDTDISSDIDMTDMADLADANSTGSIGFLQTLRSHWLVILIVLAILDIASIVMLVITSKWERKREEAELRAQMNADGEVHLIRPVTKKKRKGSGLAWLIPVVGMVLLAVLVKSMADSTTETSSETEETVYTMTAETGTIDTVLPGTGTLAEEDSSDITLPEGVEISAWYFADGDTVEEGDVLAKLDTSSIMSVIATVQESLDELDEELAEHEDDAVDEEMLATTSGRVIKIYAEEDASVIDIMYENGALMLISLDGLMAVSIETDEDLSVGASLDVTFSDDTVVTGKVESYINGTAVITMDDECLGVDEEVTVTNEDGGELGTGTVYIHSELKVTGYTGTISEISVAEGDEVEAEDTLLVLTDVDYTAEYEMLLAERTELEETMQELFSLYADPYLYATCSGVISGLDDTTVTASADTDTVYLGMNTVTVTYIVSTSSNDEAETTSEETEESAEPDTQSGDEAKDESNLEIGTQNSTDTQMSISEMEIGMNEPSSDEEFAGETEVETEELSEAGDADDVCISYIGVVTSVQSSYINMLLLPENYYIEKYSDLSGIDLKLDNMTEEAILDASVYAPVFAVTDEGWTVGSLASVSEGDLLVVGYYISDDETSLEWIVNISDEVSEDGAEGNVSGENAASDENGSYLIGSSSNDVDGAETSNASGEDVAGESDFGTIGSSSNDVDAVDDFGTSGETSENGETDMSGMSDMSGDSDDFSSEFGSTDSTDDGSTMSSDFSTDGSTDMSLDASADASSETGLEASADDTSAEEAVMETLQEEISSSYGVGETTWLTVTPQDNFTISITVDELDILSVEVGQEVQVTLDAFPGQSFTGEVTDIDLTGTNSGGNSKYTVEVTIDRGEDMLVGMNASVKITLDTSDEVLVIPEDALVEDGSAVYVYTTYDEETGELGGLTEVTTGVSDGENVEILSGLSEGSTYYYSILDIVNYSSATASSSSSGTSFSLDSLLGGGNSGGGMGGMGR